MFAAIRRASSLIAVANRGDKMQYRSALGANLGYLKFTDSPTWNPF
jgi:hypothetical protein